MSTSQTEQSLGHTQTGTDSSSIKALTVTDASSKLFDSSYDSKQVGSSSVAQDSAFRIVNDQKMVQDAKADQEYSWSLPNLVVTLGETAVGALGVIETAGVSAALAATGIGTFAYLAARGFKDGADWKAAGDDVDTTLDRLLKLQEEGILSTNEVEHFASLMHDLPTKSLAEIFNDDQLDKYERLVAGAAKQST